MSGESERLRLPRDGGNGCRWAGRSTKERATTPVDDGAAALRSPRCALADGGGGAPAAAAATAAAAAAADVGAAGAGAGAAGAAAQCRRTERQRTKHNGCRGLVALPCTDNCPARAALQHNQQLGGVRGARQLVRVGCLAAASSAGRPPALRGRRRLALQFRHHMRVFRGSHGRGTMRGVLGRRSGERRERAAGSFRVRAGVLRPQSRAPALRAGSSNVCGCER